MHQRLLFVNPSSGRHATDVAELRERFPDFEVVDDAEDLKAAIDAAIADGADVIGVAGGDGTVSTAAQCVRDTEAALLVVPGGTRNHFAQDIGIADLDAAVDAASGRVVRVDVGAVNGESFVNNASVGTYARVVRKREQAERRLPKWLANWRAALSELRHGKRLHVEIEGSPQAVWSVFVGNGEYGDKLRDVSKRDSLNEGVLDLRVVRADARVARLRVIAATLFGRLDASPLVERRRLAAVHISGAQTHIDVSLDGEVQSLALPLDFTSDAHALRVLIPATTES